MGKRKKIKALRAQIEELTERLPDKDDLFDQPKKKRGFLRKVAFVGLLTAVAGAAVAVFKSQSGGALLPPYSPTS